MQLMRLKHVSKPRDSPFFGRFFPITHTFTEYESHIGGQQQASAVQEFLEDIPKNRPEPSSPCGTQRIPFHYDFPIVQRDIQYTSIFNVFSKIGGF